MYKRPVNFTALLSALMAFPSAGTIGQFLPLTPTVALDGYVAPQGSIPRRNQYRSRYTPHQGPRERARRLSRRAHNPERTSR